MNALQQGLALLVELGIGSWAVLFVADTAIGWIKKTSGTKGKWSWQYFENFLVSNFATKQALAMLGLGGSAVTTLIVQQLAGSNATLGQLVATGSVAFLTAFATGIAARDTALVKDILSKLSS